MALKVLLFFVISATVCWSATNGEEIKKNNTFQLESVNYTALEMKFKAKYFGKSYVKWQKVHEAKPVDLETLCQKYALMLSRDERTNAKAIGKKSYRDRYMLMGYGENEAVELDTVTCIVSFLNKKGKATSSMKYFLAEGDEPNTAFRFSLLQTTIVLTRMVTDIWAESKSSDYNVKLEIRRYNTTSRPTTTKATKATTKGGGGKGGGTKAAAAGNATTAATAATKAAKKKSKKA